MRKTYPFAVLLLGCSLSCKTVTIQCSNASVELYFIGFQQTDLKKAYVLTYKKDNAFDTLIDSAGLNQEALHGTSDTLYTWKGFDDGYDYKIVLPALSQAYAITGLTPGTNYTQRYQQGIVNNELAYSCINNTTSYTLNGKMYGQPASTNADFNIVYINK